ncbi:DNA end-binding protein Ku [Georgenia soli]|uniref:Non-homologous end joining protein Ku n=1 Tax=Georgenia soli TaxID=638953 RepID=A0A2A9EP66_9MICO|nr:Ku protein [Georgenia soli]PFG40887.1 DNA end-binding protein Ku [Georgenia soli]
MRAIWKGAITFGLVNVPVKLYSATESHDVPLHQVHDADGGRIRYQRRCEICGNVVDYENIDRAYDDGQQTVVLTKDDFAALPSERNREIDVQEFVPTEQVDPIMMGSAYYLAPDSKSTKSYALLRETLEQTDRTAIVTFTLRQKTRLAALRVRDDVLVLQTLLWQDEVREADFPGLDEKVSISDKELQMSAALVKSFESDFTPEQFTDEYQEQLRELVTAKLEQGEALDTEATFGEEAEAEEGGQVLDLMEALRRSVEQSRQKRGNKDEEPTAEGASEKAAPDDEADEAEEKKPARRSSSRSRASSSSSDGEKKTASRSRAKKDTTETAEEKADEKTSGSRSSRSTTKKDTEEKPAAKKSTTRKTTSRKTPAKKSA